MYALMGLFACVFLVGFLPGPSNLFLVPLLLYGVASLILLSFTLASSAGGSARRFLLLAGFSALGFTAGGLYGTVSMWGFYEIYDPLYLTWVIVSSLGFVGGAAMSLASLRRS